MTPQEQRIQARDALTSEAARFSQVECRIPQWEPVGLPEALAWVQGRIYEGWYVAWKWLDMGERGVVQFKYWEFGEDEPSF